MGVEIVYNGRKPKRLVPFYKDDYAVLFHADCRPYISKLRKVCSVMVTDPPYGIRQTRKRFGTNSKNLGIYSLLVSQPYVAGDENTSVRDDVLARWQGLPAVVFGFWSKPKPVATKQCLVWKKIGGGMSPMFISDYEEIYLLGSGFRRLPDYPVLSTVILGHYFLNGKKANEKEENKRYVRLAKPLSLMRLLIRRCPEGIVLDPFAGSGSTLRAAKDIGVKSIGFEVDREMCEIAAARLADESRPAGFLKDETEIKAKVVRERFVK